MVGKRRHHGFLIGAAIGWMLVFSVGVSAQNEDSRWVQGQKLAQSLCIACHGPQGLSVSPIWPSIAGQKYSYLVKSMKDYRSGLRQDPLMTPQSQTLTDAQIDAAAWYYSSLAVQIAPPTQGSPPSGN